MFSWALLLLAREEESLYLRSPRKSLAHVSIFTGLGLLLMAPVLRVSLCFPISGLLIMALQDCPYPKFYRSGIARDCSGIANVPIFVCPGLLGIAPGSPMSQYLQVRDCS